MRDFAWVGRLQGLWMLLPLLSFPYLYYVLGEERFGALVAAQALSGLFAVVADFGFRAYLTRELPLRPTQEHPALAATLSSLRRLPDFQGDAPRALPNEPKSKSR